ncbi:MAG: hypothetical protein ACTSUK_08375 [Promethearchaeota archaeon]
MIIGILLIAGIVYFTVGKKPSGSETITPPTKAETKVFRASLGTTPIPEGQTPPLTLYDPLLESWFEGWDRLYYEFAYPENEFAISTSDDNRKITIKEKEAGRIHTVTITYEGGRGFTPNDYWNEVLKKECPTCQQIGNPIAIKDAQGLMTFASEEKEWIIFGSPSRTAWLFVAELLKPASSVEQVLTTFTFIQPEEQEGPYIKVISPNGGERWTVGETQYITWDSKDVERVAIELRQVGGVASVEIAYLEDNLGIYSWKVSDPQSVTSMIDSKKLRVFIFDRDKPGISDMSDGDFSIEK